MKLLTCFLLSLTLPLVAAPALYEGFDFPGKTGRVGSADAISGASSQGWLSGWHLEKGRSRAQDDDLGLAGLDSSKGLISSKSRTAVMRQVSETFTGDVFGSFRVRASELRPKSIMALMIHLPNVEDVNPKKSLISFLATRWKSDQGAILLGGRPMKIQSGPGIRAGETALVLWKMGNLPDPGEASNQTIEMWILNEAQASNFASMGMAEQALREADLGNRPDQVMQYMEVKARDSKLTLVKGLVISCFSTGVPGADFDEIRVSRESLADAAGVGGKPALAYHKEGRKEAKPGSPNILFITMDDMNYDSMGAYGSEIPNITPHMDSLAKDGMRFQYAYNQTSSCVPSRTTYQTGRYPHTSGFLSFYNVDASYFSLPEILRRNGYFTAVINKPRDTSINDNYGKFWDFHQVMKGADKRGAPNYATHFKTFLDEVKEEGRPFYCIVNIADPHKPFYNDKKSKEKGFDKYAPSTRFETDDVSIPEFLPEHPEILKEMRNYYNSVKRGDDCVGAVLTALRERGLEDDTIVIFISDHGMPLPYAKSSLYADGLRTPWVVKWPGVAEAGYVDQEHLVSAIDFMPTILDIADLDIPEGVQGKSILPAIKGKEVEGLDKVFAEFNDNAGGLSFPMRAVHTERYLYIFNPWGTGNHNFRSAATWHKSENVMKRMAKKDPEVAERYDFLRHRTVEEFYDLKEDPHSLNNLIDDPAYADTIESMRGNLESWMRQTDDYVLEAFWVREDPIALDAFMQKADAAALKRAETLQWKRYKNRAGGTGKNTKLYQN